MFRFADPACGEVVFEDGIQRVDELAARHRVARLPGSSVHGGSACRSPLAHSGYPVASKHQGHMKQLCTPDHEGKVEAVEVVVFNHVGIERLDTRAQLRQEGRLGEVIHDAGGLQNLRRSVGSPEGDEENPVDVGIEPGGLEIELHPPQVVEGEPAEVGTPRAHRVLLLRREREHGLRAELADMAQRLPEPAGRTGEQRAGELPSVGGEDLEAERTRTVELAEGDLIRGRVAGALRPESGAEMSQIHQRREQQPGPEPNLLARERTALRGAPPERHPAFGLGRDRDDAGR